MNKGMIKISQTQWLASGIEKGYVKAEEDGTFTLNKEAQLARALGRAVGAVGKAVGPSLKNPYVRSGLIGAGLGSLASLVGRSNLIQAAQDWWSGGKETPEMLKSLQEAKARFEQDVAGRLAGISDRLDNNIQSVREKLDERIATFTQRLGERGLGPAFEKGQQLLADDQMTDEMMLAAQKPPVNSDTIAGLIRGSSGSTPAPVAAAPATTTTPAQTAAPVPTGQQQAKSTASNTAGTGSTRMLNEMMEKGGV